MDGNQRYAKKKNLDESAGYKAGFLYVMSMLKYCNELGVKYDNFKRPPKGIMQEKIVGLLKEENFVNQHEVTIYFMENFRFLNENVRVLAENSTAENAKCVLLICVAHSSSYDI